MLIFNKLKIKSFLILGILGNVSLAIGQQEQALNFMQEEIWQSNLTNPAFSSKRKYTLALPSTYFNINSNFALNNLFSFSGSERQLLASNAANTLDNQNILRGSLDFGTIGIGIPFGKFRFNLHHSLKTNAELGVPKSIFQLAAKGNAQFSGQTVSFAPSVDFMTFSELGLGAAYITENWHVGARLKRYNGIAGIKTDPEKIDITFDETTYNITGNTDFGLVAYGINMDSLIKGSYKPDTKNMFAKNGGLGFDIGATYRFSIFEVAASVLDLNGKVKWSVNEEKYSTKGNYTFRGVTFDDVDNIFKFDSLNFRDSLKTAFNWQKTNNSANYEQAMPTRIYLTGSVKLLNERLKVGVLYYSEIKNGVSNNGFAVNGTFSPVRWLSAGLTVGQRYGKLNNVGAHFVFKTGLAQFYFVSDNVLRAFTPLAAKSANARFGVNMTFGKSKD